MARDWTTSDEGRANSSERFEELTDAVANIIRGSAHDLIAGRSRNVAGLIMAQLAHVHGVGPLPTREQVDAALQASRDAGGVGAMFTEGSTSEAEADSYDADARVAADAFYAYVRSK